MSINGQQRPSRRQFLHNSALLIAGAALPAWFVEASRAADVVPTTARSSANDRPHALLVGCGGRGMSLAHESKKWLNLVAVCDVDAKHLANAAADFPDAKAYSDFRKAIAHKGIDAVITATPDHWHTLVNLHAMRSGKDVYSEKPLTLTIAEGRKLVEVASDTKRVFQTGSQQRSDARFRLACELVRNGRVGKLKQVLVALPAGPRKGPFETSPVPPELNWDFWQGQTPAHEYVKERCHGTFRHWYDYSGGTVTDWGAHHNDIALWGLGLDHSGPVSIDATRQSEPIDGGFTAVADYRIVYTYANGIEHVCFSERLDAGNGAPAPSSLSVSTQELTEGHMHHGVKFIGESGWIYVTRGRIVASDPDLLKQELPAGAERLYVSDNHMGNFVECIRTRKETICPPEVGHRSVSVCHLGNLSLRLKRRLQWDPQRERFVDDKEADTYLSREMRKPWSLETV